MAGFNLENYTGYEAALDQVHKLGISKTDSNVVQFPNEDNGWTAVVKATIVLSDGREFNALGDANSDSIKSGSIKPHYIRMAETRAKGRVYREAINDGGDPDLGSGKISGQQAEDLILKSLDVLGQGGPTRVAQRYGKDYVADLTMKEAVHAGNMLDRQVEEAAAKDGEA
jgi:hypothetical protein